MTDLAPFYTEARDILGEDFIRLDCPTHRVPIAWPEVLALGTIEWLDSGCARDERLAQLFPVLDHVEAGEWGTVWSDPGVYPSNAGGSPLPDRVYGDDRPSDLARMVRGLLDEMGIDEPQRGAA